MSRSRVRASTTVLVLTLLAAAPPLAAAPLAAQSALPCDFERCGLRIQGRTVHRGPAHDPVATAGTTYPDLRFLIAAGDSVEILARDAVAHLDRATAAHAIAALAIAPSATLVYGSTDWLDHHENEGWTALGLVAAGYIAAFIGSRAWRRADEPLSRAVWHYNRAVVSGDVPGTPPPLPPLDPAHFGRTGFGIGLVTGATVGMIVVRGAAPDESVWVPGFAYPWAGAAAGWLVGRLIPRAGD